VRNGPRPHARWCGRMFCGPTNQGVGPLRLGGAGPGQYGIPDTDFRERRLGEVRGIPLPRTSVNKPLRGAPGFVVWHASRR
jgi:hypothetical protein